MAEFDKLKLSGNYQTIDSTWTLTLAPNSTVLAPMPLIGRADSTVSSCSCLTSFLEIKLICESKTARQELYTSQLLFNNTFAITKNIWPSP